MGLGSVASLVFSLSQLSYLIVAKDILASERSFHGGKPIDTGAAFYPGDVQVGGDEEWRLANAGDSIRPFKDNGKESIAPEQTKRWNEMAVWGKRGSDLDAYDADMDKRWKEMAVWGKRDDDGQAALDKRWKEMAVWGKRAGDLQKRWKEMAVWGKRGKLPDLDKRWKEMAVWGKRSYHPNSDLWELSKDFPSERDVQEAVQQYRSNDNDVRDWSNQEFLRNPTQTHLTRVLRQHGLSQEQLAHARARLARYSNNKRPSWSNSGFSSWGKRADSADKPGTNSLKSD